VSDSVPVKIPAASPQVPSIGRVVHYVSYGTPGGEFPSTCRAAIITAVGRKKKGVAQVSLFVMNPEGVFLNQNVPYSEDASVGGSWHWPERV
jgi:hypothetical protein